MGQLKTKVANAHAACILNQRVYKYMVDENADLSTVEQDVKDARRMGMRFHGRS